MNQDGHQESSPMESQIDQCHIRWFRDEHGRLQLLFRRNGQWVKAREILELAAPELVCDVRSIFRASIQTQMFP
jgi:hypothetical protein